jgi:uncharacterized protein (UPF0218 family)
MKTFYLPEKLRSELQKIWGIAIFGSEKDVISEYEHIIKGKKFKKIITVGDHCSSKLFSDVKIFDGKIERKDIQTTLTHSLTCKNPAGTIQSDVWPIIQKAINTDQNIFVHGEEDLLVIPVVLLSEIDSLVVYGFFSKGVCLVKVSEKVKKDFQQLLDKFDPK